MRRPRHENQLLSVLRAAALFGTQESSFAREGIILLQDMKILAEQQRCE